MRVHRPQLYSSTGTMRTENMQSCESRQCSFHAIEPNAQFFSGAFYTLVRSTALDRMTVAGAQTSTVSALISNTTARVNISGQHGEAFPTNIRVVQGDPLWPTMFNMYAEEAMRKIDAVSSLARTQDVPSPSTRR